MLEKVRENAAGWMVKTVLWLLVAAFVGTIFLVWGYGDQQGKQPVAKVGGQVITAADFDARYKRLRQQLEKMGDSIPKEFFEGKEMQKRVLNDMVLEKLQHQATLDAGILVSDEEVSAEIMANPSFQTNGAFDKNAYEAIIRNNRMTPIQFENILRNDLASEKLVKSITDSVDVTEKEILDRYISDYSEVNVRYLAFDPADFRSRVNLSEGQIKAYHEKNSLSFMQPEQRVIEYLFADPKKLAGNSDISATEIKDYYDMNAERFKRDEKFRAHHIITLVPEGSSQEMVEELRKKTEGYLDQIKSGTDFYVVAKKHSEDGSASTGGDLGYFGPGEMDPDFENALRKMKPGELSGVVKTRYGFHIIRLDEHTEAGYLPIEAATEDIRQAILAGRGNHIAKTKINKIVKEYPSKWSESVSGEAGIEFRKTTVEIGKKLDIGEDWNKLVKRAFSLNKGESTQPIELSSGFYAVHLKEILPPRLKRLDEVRPDIVRFLTASESRELARKTAQTFKDMLKEMDISKAAVEMKSKAAETGFFSKKNKPAGVASSNEFINAAFANKKGDSVLLSIEGKEYVLQVAERRDADTAQLPLKRDAIRDELLVDKRFAVISKWRKSLYDTAEKAGLIEIDPLFN